MTEMSEELKKIRDQRSDKIYELQENGSEAYFEAGFDLCYSIMSKTHVPLSEVQGLVEACDNMKALIDVNYKEVNKSADRIELEFCDALTQFSLKHKER